MNPLDTLIWLVNFPASHGYAMVFIAGFSLFGLFALSMSGRSPRTGLRAVREREGLTEDQGTARADLRGTIVRGVFRVLAVLMLANLVIGILSLVGVPITRAYIHEHGRPAAAVVDGDWVTFTTDSGVEYTLPNDFFTPSTYPDRDAYVPSGESATVRYLPDHPQAFVIDTSQSER